MFSSVHQGKVSRRDDLRRERRAHAQPEPLSIEPSEEERADLKKRARSHTGAYWEVVRARIVLLASEKISNKEIASRLDTSPQVVWKWRKRFHQEGLEGWKTDLVRAGPQLSPRSKDGGEGHSL